MRIEELEAICERVGLSVEDLRGLRQSPDIAFKKKIVYYILRHKKLMTLQEVGRMCNKDHSTINKQLVTLNTVIRNIGALTSEVDFDGVID